MDENEVQDQNVNEQSSEENQPNDLEAAFKYLNTQKQEDTQGDVGVTSTEEPAQQEDIEPAAETPSYDNGYIEDGGDADSDDVDVDYDEAAKSYAKDLGKQALQEVAKEWKQKNWYKYDVRSLIQRDERSGSVTFKNPENPNRDFQSREEAQRWVDSINREIEDSFKKEVSQRQAKLLQEKQSTLRLLAFGNTYKKMSGAQKEVFDDLISDYEVLDSNGDVVGYSCDLNRMANQASRIASRYSQAAPKATPQQAKPAAKPVSRPATDMPSGNNSAGEERAPKTLQEAWSMLNEQDKKGRK